MHNQEALYFTALLSTPVSKALALHRRTQRNWFTPQFQPVYDIVQTSVSTFGRLPAPETVARSCAFAVAATAPEDVAFYADRVFENAKRSGLETGFVERVVPLLNAGKGEAAIDMAAAVIAEVRATFGRPRGEVKNVVTTTDARLAAYELRAKAPNGITGFPTPWPTITSAIGGLRPGDACVILARQSMGKTWIAVLWATFLWMRLRLRVLLVSMETPAEDDLPQDRSHRIISGMCFYCYEKDRSPDEHCPAADVPRQRLCQRIDAVGAHISAWRFLRGQLLPDELDRYKRFLAASAAGRFGDLRVAGRADIGNLNDLETAIATYKPDVVIWDSAYLGVSRLKGDKRNEAMGNLVTGFEDLTKRTQIPGILTWHFNREVSETDTAASVNCASETDEIGKRFDLALGLFRPPELEAKGEAILRALKTRDGLRVAAIRTNFEVARRLDLSEIGEYTPEERGRR